MFKRNLLLVFLFLPVILLFSFQQPWHITADVWELAASIQELSLRPFSPQHPMLAGLSGSDSPRFTPYTLFWGLFMRFSQMDVLATLNVMSLLNYLLFLSGLYRFVKWQLKQAESWRLCFVLMLMIWGTGYDWANAYHFYMFFYTLPYVGTFALALMLHAFADLGKSTQSDAAPNPLPLSLFIFYAVVIFLSHPITGACLLGVSAVMLLLQQKWKMLIGLMPFVVLLCVLSLYYWPYFDYMEVFRSGTVEAWYQTELFSHQLVALGTLPLGFICCLDFLKRREQLALVASVLATSMVYLLSWSINLQIGGRFIFYTALFLHITIGIWLYEKREFVKNVFTFKVNERIKSGIIFIFAIILVFPSFYFRAKDVKRMLFATQEADFSPLADYMALEAFLETGDVVMVEAGEGWVLPALTQAKVIAPENATPLALEECLKRREQVASFFGQELSQEARKKSLRQYGCTHILTDTHRLRHQALPTHLSTFTQQTAQIGTLTLWEISPSD